MTRWRTGRDRGSASIEFLGFLPILILVALAAVQLGIAAYAVQQAGTAARAAARTGSLDEPGTPDTAGKAAISGWLAGGTNISGGSCGGGEAQATATVKIPSVIPGFDGFGSAERSATMPCDDGQLQAAGGRP
ncbi:TadE/TadG family type IV pilus assembly protein [Streptomyces sp. NBRC 110028]|uniref:TadE/TadG family type IV pilus assembly protein n=1 Tax=Streptomyces sp. NBRC 110028 TaxID=1621260 RepID=UPI0006E3C72B|nr:TadE/TadG family type IV pilus assembly protein [Streptomyces sp. NBRC 110028]